MVVESKNSNLYLVFLGAIAVFVLGVTLFQLKAVLMPLVIAFLLSIIFKPAILWLRSKRVPMPLALFGVLVLSSAVLFLVGWVLFSSTQSFIEELPKYEAKATVIAADLEAALLQAAARFEVDVAEFQWSDAFEWSNVTNAVTTGVGSFLSFVSTTFLILLFMLFILAGSGEMAEKVRVAFPPVYAKKVADLVSNVDGQVRRYLVTKTVISLATGVMTWLVLSLLGVDFPLIWGFLAFLLNFIPNIGSTIAVLFPFAVSLLQFETLVIPFVVLFGLGTVQMTLGNVVEPRVMGFRLNLSPLLILVSLILWGWLWGLWGMIIAVPITSTLKILFENMDPLRPISILMSGKVEEPVDPVS
jgi:predicted PurR-regulated permease PerM